MFAQQEFLNIGLADLVCLDQNVVMVVPSTVDAIEGASEQMITSVIDTVSTEFSDKLGGVTVTSGKGGWVSVEYGLIFEDITLVESSFSDLDEENTRVILQVAHYVKNAMSQESVAFKLNGKLYLY